MYMCTYVQRSVTGAGGIAIIHEPQSQQCPVIYAYGEDPRKFPVKAISIDLA